MKTTNCIKCQTQIAYEPILIAGKEMFSRRLCEPCMEAGNKEAEIRSQQESLRTLTLAWESICPPLYRRTDPNHPDINQTVLLSVMEWRDNDDGMGLCLIGPSGKCKTRIMLLLAKRIHFEGGFVFFVPATLLAWAFQNQFGSDPRNGEAREIITKAHSCRVLALDDVGKEKFTETVERDFYDLVEHRTSHLKPTHWTANATGPQLEAMMSSDRGGAIMRRLREFTEAIGV